MKNHLIYQPGKNPEVDARFTAFLIENHLDYLAHPDHAATPEQISFMVHIQENERYYPCSDQMFEAIMNRSQSTFLQKKYNEVLQKLLDLIHTHIRSKSEKRYLESLIKHKYKHETKDEIMIPSRLEKRLSRIFLNQTQIEDPCWKEKALRNTRIKSIFKSKAFKTAINKMTPDDLPQYPETLSKIKKLVERIEIERLINLSGEKQLWETDLKKKYSVSDYSNIFSRKLAGNGVKSFFNFLGISKKGESKDTYNPRKILWLANESGEIMVDLKIIQYLTKLGHKVILSIKEGSLFTKVTLKDVRDEEIPGKEIEGAFFITEKDMNKNNLVKIFRSDNHIFVVSDGTRENLNLLLTSTTFARVFKEVDGVVSRGDAQKIRFFETHFQFTQDIFNISSDNTGNVHVSFKSKSPETIKFSHTDLEQKAKAIINKMEEAREKGMTVIFYSGIIGSIPGKIDTAKKIMSVFVKHLKKQFDMTYIINPSEYFEPGMDADDLMYMWEIVQHSGFIDIWRFQTYDDILTSFQIMKEKVPPEWVGKDATYSTGCTKEMRIALEVVSIHPEMQIIGPSREKFVRRNEYGIGKMYDARL